MSTYGTDYSAHLADREARSLDFMKNASPILVWQANEGVIIIAPRRNNDHRITTILDRCALASRGASSAGAIIATETAGVAWDLAQTWTRQHVSVKRLATFIGSLVQERLYQFNTAPLAAETVLIATGEVLETDLLRHITYRGEVQSFEKVLLLGSVNAELYGDNTDGVMDDHDSFKELQDRLRRIWRPDVTYSEIPTILSQGGLPAYFQELTSQFVNSRKEVVVLSREAVRKNKPYEVVERISSG